jgi:hypothetical protein
MRYLGTLMLLASVGMLLFPSLWEGRLPLSAASSQAEEEGTGVGQSTLRPDDLLPAWRGPLPRGEKDG